VLYLFSSNGAVQEAVVNRTQSGNVCINDVVLQLAIPDLPFGGVGASGMGRYHGRFSFETFTRPRGVLTKSFKFDLPLRYPPYSDAKARWIQRLS
jgi:aldehyde dehydrogenase (NAD+)